MNPLLVVGIPILKQLLKSDLANKEVSFICFQKAGMTWWSEKQLTKYWTALWLPIKHNCFVNSTTTPPFPKNSPEKTKTHSSVIIHASKLQQAAKQIWPNTTKIWSSWTTEGMDLYVRLSMLWKTTQNCFQIAKKGIKLTPTKCRVSALIKFRLQLWNRCIYCLNEKAEYFMDHIRNCVVS